MKMTKELDARARAYAKKMCDLYGDEAEIWTASYNDYIEIASEQREIDMADATEQIIALQWHRADVTPQDDEWKLCCIDKDESMPQCVCLAYYNVIFEKWIDEADGCISVDWWMEIPPLPKIKIKEG